MSTAIITLLEVYQTLSPTMLLPPSIVSRWRGLRGLAQRLQDVQGVQRDVRRVPLRVLQVLRGSRHAPDGRARPGGRRLDALDERAQRRADDLDVGPGASKSVTELVPFIASEIVCAALYARQSREGIIVSLTFTVFHFSPVFSTVQLFSGGSPLFCWI